MTPADFKKMAARLDEVAGIVAGSPSGRRHDHVLEAMKLATGAVMAALAGDEDAALEQMQAALGTIYEVA